MSTLPPTVEIGYISQNVGNTPQRVKPHTYPFKKCILQNISQNDIVLQTNFSDSDGIRLNAAPSNDKGGGSLALTNYDLFQIWFNMSNSGTGTALSYILER